MTLRTWMNKRAIYAAPLLALLLMFGVGCSDDDDDDGVGPEPTSSYVRLAHMASAESNATTAAVGNVNVLAGGTVILSDVAYQDISGYAEVDAGSHDIDVVEVSSGTTVASGSIDLDENMDYTLAFYESGGSGTFELLMDDETNSNSQGLLRVVHGSETAGTLSLSTRNEISLATGLQYMQSSSYKLINEGTYTVEVFASGQTDAMSTFGGVEVVAGESMTLWLTGTAEGDGGNGLNAMLSLDSDPGTGGASTRLDLFTEAMAWVRGANFIVTPSSAIQITLAGATLGGMNNYELTGYAEIEPGTHQVIIQTLGGVALASANVSFEAANYYTALGGDFSTPGNPNDNMPQLRVLMDMMVSGGSDAMVRLAHESPDLDEELELVNSNTGNVIAGSVDYQDHTQYVSIAAGTDYDLELRGATSGTVYDTMTNQDFEASTAYTIYARGSADLGNVEGQKVVDAQ